MSKIIIIVPGLPFDIFALDDNVVLVSEEYVDQLDN